MPDPSPVPETRRAIALVFVLGAMALLVYAAMSLVITDDSAMVAYGRSGTTGGTATPLEVHWLVPELEGLDRAALGDRPVVWIFGASVVRDAIDADEVETQLDIAGLPHAVRKYAFDRGVPLFSWGMVDKAPLVPGDLAIIGVAPDQFRVDWLDSHTGSHAYLPLVLAPWQALRIGSMAVPERLENALAGGPGRSFWMYRDTYRAGVERWLRWETGRGSAMPELRERHFKQPFRSRMRTRGWKDESNYPDRHLRDADMRLQAGQVNYDALVAVRDELGSRGIDLWVLNIPASAAWAPGFLPDPGTERRFHDHMAALGPPYVQLPRPPQGYYVDYTHPNPLGRATLTRALARRLIDALGPTTRP